LETPQAFPIALYAGFPVSLLAPSHHPRKQLSRILRLLTGQRRDLPTKVSLIRLEKFHELAHGEILLSLETKFRLLQGSRDQESQNLQIAETQKWLQVLICLYVGKKRKVERNKSSGPEPKVIMDLEYLPLDSGSIFPFAGSVLVCGREQLLL
jgi:hypothetical protein